jgi:recombinational DNA repair protein (RecF pathway)
MRPTAAEEVGEALVLARHPWRDGFVVALLTSQSVRRDMLAPHAARSKTRLGAHLDGLNRCEIAWREEPHRDLPVLVRATALETFPTLREQIERLALGLSICEVAAHLVADGSGEPGFFELTLGALRAIDDARRTVSEDLLLYFELRGLTVAGVLRPLDELPDPPTREVFGGWLAGRWQPLTPRGRRVAAAWLEAQLAELSGQPLRSRGFLDDVLKAWP